MRWWLKICCGTANGVDVDQPLRVAHHRSWRRRVTRQRAAVGPPQTHQRHRVVDSADSQRRVASTAGHQVPSDDSPANFEYRSMTASSRGWTCRRIPAAVVDHTRYRLTARGTFRSGDAFLPGHDGSSHAAAPSGMGAVVAFSAARVMGPATKAEPVPGVPVMTRCRNVLTTG
jgi:hypothetical protein